MEIWAHRGASSLKAENTLEAFEEALKYNVHGIELDVRLSATGEPVVFHDPTLWRVCKDPTPVALLTPREINERVSYHVPTLDEALTLLAGKTNLVLDLKTTTMTKGELEQACLRAVREHGCSHMTTFSSTVFASICKLFVLDRDCNKAFIMDGKMQLPLATILNCPIHVKHDLLTKEYMQKLKKKFFKVRAWTVNDVKLANNYRQLGVEGIITDRPQDYISS